jgi:hypothetical protein
MTRSVRTTSRFDATPDRLVAALTDPAYLEARVSPGSSAGIKVQEVARDAQRLVQEVRSEDYARTMTGGFDRSRTAPSVTTWTWDLAARRATWTWRTEQEARVKIRGSVAVQAAGAGSEMVSEFEAEVKIPLMGGMIEKSIVEEVGKDQARIDGLVRAALARLASG